MTRILLADDSPHAQRMGERILSDEGFEVVTVSNGDSALIRLEDADPDVVIADAVMPGRGGYEICQYVKMSPRLRHVRVVITAGALETLDENQASRAGADATLRKPFEATALLEVVRRLAGLAREARGETAASDVRSPAAKAPAAPFLAVLDPDKVRAAVTVALDASMGAMVEEITTRVLAILSAKTAAEPAPAVDHPPAPQPVVVPLTLEMPVPPIPAVPEGPKLPASAAAAPQQDVSPQTEPGPAAGLPPAAAPAPAAPPPAEEPSPESQPARRVRTASKFSILGLDSGPEEPGP